MSRQGSWTGLDIGSTGVRAVRVAGLDDEGFAIIERFSVVPTRGDVCVGGKIRNQTIVAQAVKKALKNGGAKSGSIVVGLSAAEQGMARVALPVAVKAQERLGAIRTMGVQVASTVPTSEAVLSSNFVREESTADGRKVAALIVAAASAVDVDMLTKVCRQAGYEPRAIDLSGLGTLRSLVRDIPSSRDSAIIVDIGATSTTIIVREGLYVRSIRSFAGGGLDITRAIASAARESLEAAEKRKYALRLPLQSNKQNTGYGGFAEDDEDLKRLSSENAVERALTIASDTLIDQIAQAIESDSGAATRYIALCGGTCLLRGFQERLERRIGVDVRKGHPWARLERSKANVDYFVQGREDPKLMLTLTTATGLALWRDVE